MYHDLYELLHQETKMFRIRLAEESHDVFRAHFTGNPLLPGFIFFEICSYILHHDIVSIRKAKFMRPAKPMDVLEFYVTQKGKETRVDVKKDDKKIAEMVYASF